jgi:haloacetate dehalogenase
VFEQFRLDNIDTGEVILRVRYGGTGPAVLLLHGHPRTHTTWYAVAPALARAGYTVVCPDLRGYGQSSKPASDADHTPYSKRAMAADVVALMDHLGHERFAVAGHDRGSYVAYRTALDHPDRVTKLVVMDGVPVVEALERCDSRFAALWWHWWFFAQTGKPAERVICADPETWYQAWTTNSPDALGPENHTDFLFAIRDPATVHAMVEDLPGRPGYRSSGRRGGPRGRPADRVPDADAVVDPRRHGGPVRRPGGGLEAVVSPGDRPGHRVDPPHRRARRRRPGRLSH